MSHITDGAPSHIWLESSASKEKIPVNASRDGDVEGSEKKQPFGLYSQLRPYILTALALLILAWWISATILKETRHRW